MPNGDVHTGKSHNASSQKLFHLEDLSATVQKKVKGKGEGAKRLKKSIIDKSSGGYGY